MRCRPCLCEFRLCVILVGLLSASFAAPPVPEGIETLKPGSKAPAFNLPGVDGKNHTLQDYADADILAVLFTCNHCPSAQGAESRVKKLVKDYESKSFQLIAISPNDPDSIRLNELGYSVYGDTLDDMKKHAKDRGFDFPYLYDGETQATAKEYGAMVTPHIFIFDKERILRYVGRIDDSRFGDPATIKVHDARAAIDALLAGNPVAKSTTRAQGCSTKWAFKRHLVKEYNEAFEAKKVTLEKADSDLIAELAANKTDKLRLINIWATWCGPCIAEMPNLIEIGRQFETRGFDMITISLDDPGQIDKVQTMLQRFHAAMPRLTEASVKEEGRNTNNYLFDGDTDSLATALDEKWDGTLPYSILIAPSGEIIYRVSGEVDPDKLRQVIVEKLGRFYSPR